MFSFLLASNPKPRQIWKIKKNNPFKPDKKYEIVAVKEKCVRFFQIGTNNFYDFDISTFVQCFDFEGTN